MIHFDNVSKRYPGGHEAISHVNFRLPRGGMAYLTGHSGAGKSTLLKLIALIERPSREPSLSAVSGEGGQPVKAAFTLGLSRVFLLSASYCGVALVISLLRFKRESKKTEGIGQGKAVEEQP